MVAPTLNSVVAGEFFLKQHGQRVQSFGSPRLNRLLVDLREDPEARAALDRSVRKQRAAARDPPPNLFGPSR